ncbi:MAG: response regulator, partial [Pseudomonadota bacterium]
MAKKILVVDDDDLVLTALEILLAPSGYDVTTAFDGRDALEKINKGTFDLLILDIIMPGMNGFELCKKIRGNEQFRTVPIIMLTAKSSPE